jgi:hypothetical protein
VCSNSYTKTEPVVITLSFKGRYILGGVPMSVGGELFAAMDSFD